MRSHKREADAFEAALRGAPADDAITDLVRHAEAMCARAATVEPSEDFRLALRESLMAQAPALLTAHPRSESAVVVAPTTHGFRRRVARLSAAAIVAVGGVGIVASSAQAVPGDMLYGVKRSVENVQLALHRSDASRGEFQLEQARERLAEAEHLADQGDLERSATALADFRSQADAGTADLFTDYETGGEAASVESVNDFAAESADTLVVLADQFPASSSDPIELAMDTVREIATQASSLCSECSSVTLPDLRALPSASSETTAPTAPASTPAQTPTAPASSGSKTAAPTQTAPPSVPLPLLPSASPSTAPAPQVPVVTPLVEGLLGEDGLVPTLLGGLLGQK